MAAGLESWSIPGLDLALLRLKKPLEGAVEARTILARSSPSDTVDWHTEGFPSLGKTTSKTTGRTVRQPFPFGGTLYPFAVGASIVHLHLRDGVKQPRGVKGLSGAPIFAEGRLVGVVGSLASGLSDRIKAAPLATALADDDFRAALDAGDEAVEEAVAELARDLVGLACLAVVLRPELREQSPYTLSDEGGQSDEKRLQASLAILARRARSEQVELVGSLGLDLSGASAQLKSLSESELVDTLHRADNLYPHQPGGGCCSLRRCLERLLIHCGDLEPLVHAATVALSAREGAGADVVDLEAGTPAEAAAVLAAVDRGRPRFQVIASLEQVADEVGIVEHPEGGRGADQLVRDTAHDLHALLTVGDINRGRTSTGAPVSRSKLEDISALLSGFLGPEAGVDEAGVPHAVFRDVPRGHLAELKRAIPYLRVVNLVGNREQRDRALINARRIRQMIDREA